MRIAVVDDDEKDQQRMRDLIGRYYQGDSVQYRVTCFADGEDLLADYNSSFDLVFLDIEMERMDGLLCARRLRKLDGEVAIVFSTNLAQYAASGYDVGALGYLVKPIKYYSFALAMHRAEEALQNRQDVVLWLDSGNDGEKCAVSSRDVSFVEVIAHQVVFHTAKGTFSIRGSLKEYSERLSPVGFVQCNRYYLVNLKHVVGMKGSDVSVDTGEVIEVSRRLRKQFSLAIVQYYGMR